MGKKIEYSNDELTIIWQPEVCQPCRDLRQNAASGIPSQRTPLARNRKRSDDRLIAQINCCPSGALSYRMNTK